MLCHCNCSESSWSKYCIDCRDPNLTPFCYTTGKPAATPLVVDERDLVVLYIPYRSDTLQKANCCSIE